MRGVITDRAPQLLGLIFIRYLKTTLMRNLLPLYLLLAFVLGCDRDRNPEPQPPPQPSLQFTLVEEEIINRPVIIVGDGTSDFHLAFYAELDGTPLALERTIFGLPWVFADQTGTRYDIWGVGEGGDNDGRQLEQIHAGTGFWMTFAGMFPGLSLDGGTASDIDLELDFDPDWAIPISSVTSGAGLDVIRSLDDPQFEEYRQPTGSTEYFVRAEDWIVGVNINGDIRAYPYPILTSHEIVNDVVGGLPIAVTFCPLTGTARVYRRPSGDPEFGVSGFVWNSNMLMFDRTNEENLFNQVTGNCVRGPRVGEQLEPLPYLRTNWSTWSRIYPRTLVLLPSPGLDLDEMRALEASLTDAVGPSLFPLDYIDPRHRLRDMVFCVTDGVEGKVWSLENF